MTILSSITEKPVRYEINQCTETHFLLYVTLYLCFSKRNCLLKISLNWKVKPTECIAAQKHVIFNQWTNKRTETIHVLNKLLLQFFFATKHQINSEILWIMFDIHHDMQNETLCMQTKFHSKMIKQQSHWIEK